MNSEQTLKLIILAIQAFLKYGPGLWAFIVKCIRDLRGDKNMTPEQKIAAFRSRVTREWIAKKGKPPTEKEIQTAFVLGCRKVLAA